MKKEFTTTVLYSGKRYDEGKVYELDKETAEALKHLIKEPTEEANEDGANSSDIKPTSK